MNWIDVMAFLKYIIVKGWVGGIAGLAIFISMNALFNKEHSPYPSWIICGTISFPFMFLAGCFLWIICMRGGE